MRAPKELVMITFFQLWIVNGFGILQTSNGVSRETFLTARKIKINPTHL